MTAEPRIDRVPLGVAWLGVLALTLVGAASAWLECLLVPLYVGSVIVPVTVLIALVGNWVLPRLARTLVRTGLAASLPFVGWIAVILLFGLNARPEGDVILPGGGGAMEYTTYALMLAGTVAGVASVVTAIPPTRR